MTAADQTPGTEAMRAAQSVIDQHMQRVAGRVMDVFESTDEDTLAEDIQQDVYAAIGLLEAHAASPQPAPAADAEAQWGMRREDGSVSTYRSEEQARQAFAHYRFWASAPARILVRRTVTVTPWEEA